MKLNREQKAAVEAIKNNVVVTAGAGAGKTAVLTKRFIYLLKKSGCGIDQILTLTFTKKAANEMLERIRFTLVESDDSNLKKQISQIDTASIQTLDSFCNSIAKSHFSTYGLPSTASPDEEKSKELTKSVALSWLIKNSKKPVLKSLIEVEGFDRIWNELLVPIAQGQISVVNPIDFYELAKRQLDTVKTDFAKVKELIVLEIARVLSLVNEYDESLLGKDRHKSVQAWIVYIEKLSKTFDSIDILDIKETKALINSYGSLPKKISSAIKNEMAQIIGEWTLGIKVNMETLNGAIDFLTLEKNYIEFYTLLNNFQEVLIDNRRSAGVLTFGEITLMAIDILKNNNTIRNYYKEKFRYIMVDEFQDNNELQKDLLYLLAESPSKSSLDVPTPTDLCDDKLFFVGDEKQSIYRFRGADVSVFKALGEDLKDANGKSLTLSTNYRSEPGLISFFNYFFVSLMPKKGEGSGYEAEFEPLDSRDAILESSARIDFIKVNGGEKVDDAKLASYNEADAVAKKINEYIENRVQVSCEIDDPKTGKSIRTHRDCTYKDFAILFKKTSKQHHFERLFQQHGIPYNSQIVTSFFSESIFGDLNALFQLLLYPNDKALYATVLRSPLCGIDDYALLTILEEDEALFSYSGTLLSESTLALLAKTKALYSKLLGMADVLPHYQLLDYVWFDFGYRYYYLATDIGRTMLYHFDYFRSIAMEFERENRNLAELVAWIRGKQDSFEKLDDPLTFSKAGDAVSMLTIHKSKGLQFPITILVDTGSSKNRSQGGDLYYHSKNDGLTVNIPFFNEKGDKAKANYLYQKAKDEVQCMEDAESDRVLYVAMTRAKEHLILSGFKSKGKNTPFERFSIELEKLKQEKDNIDFIGELEVFIEDVEVKDFREILGQKKRVDTIDLNSIEYNGIRSSDIVLAQNRFSVTSINEESYDPSNCEEEDLNFLEIDKVLDELYMHDVFGTLTHDLLELAIKEIDIENLPIDEYPSAILKFPPAYRGDIADSALKLAVAFLNSDIYSSIISRNPIEIMTEADFLYKEGSRYIRGRADLVVEFEDSVEIYDYKTNQIKFEREYDRQLQIYHDAFYMITGKSVSTELVYLRELI